MKKTNSVVTAITLAIFFVSSAALAAPKSSSTSSNSTFSSSPTNFSTTSKRVGVGFTTAGVLTGTGNTTAFSGWFELGPTTSLQAIFGIGNTSPFEFGIGAAFRSRISGSEASGLHIGGGVLLGTVATTPATTDFYVIISPMAGMHFNIPNYSNIFLSLDGGVNFRIIAGSFSLSAQNLSPALGASIHYIL